MSSSDLMSRTQIHKLAERYPFKDEELEILETCFFKHLLANDSSSTVDFLIRLASASPYQHFLLPGNELVDRVHWLQENILPSATNDDDTGFASRLRAAMLSDSFVEYANQGLDEKFERFIEGVANVSGRRGPKEALRVSYEAVVGGTSKGAIHRMPNAYDVVDACFRLALAADALVDATLDKQALLKHMQAEEGTVKSIADSLSRRVTSENHLDSKIFVNWAEENFPVLSMPLSTFVHNLIFHRHAYPVGRLAYVHPTLDHASDIFQSPYSPLLTALSFTSSLFGCKWNRLYSDSVDGRSFNRLEWTLLGYTGPTLVVIRTEPENTLLGAFVTNSVWKESHEFYGNAEGFLFQLHPTFHLMKPTGKEKNFIYLHSKHMHGPIQSEVCPLGHGIGFGGTLEHPRLFIPASFEHCSADYLDRTFESGNLVTPEALERFEIGTIEIWAVGGDVVMAQALRDRAAYRERTEALNAKNRVVKDKSVFVQDMKTGLFENKSFKHAEDMRGSHEFSVDDEHGGYKIDHEF